jgi:hypothetical protein
MVMAPISLRLDKELHSLLSEGSRRTTLKKQDLIRRTLREYLPQVIEQESRNRPLTNLLPLPRRMMARVYKRLARMEPEWDRIEDAAVNAQGHPRWDD